MKPHKIIVLLLSTPLLLAFSLNYKKNIDIDNLFKSWNSKTIVSLQNQMQQSNNEDFSTYSKNKIETLKKYWGISNLDEVNKTSIRFQFLLEVMELKKNNDFYIIEANQSGERVIIQNYLIYIKNKKTEIYRFEYLKGKGWSLEEKFSIKGNIFIKPYEYYTLYGEGANRDDVIITHFNNNTVEGSYYYVYSTMENFSLIFNFL